MKKATGGKINENVEMSVESARTLMALAMNSTLSTIPAQLGRAGFMGRGGAGGQFDGRRDVEEACGYKKQISFDDFLATYDRLDIASRIVETYPDYTWIQNPLVYETEKPKNTKFEKDWEEHLLKNNPLAELRKLDILAGIGRFGLMVIGIDDGKKLHTPLTPQDATAGKKRQVVYTRAYMEGEVTIDSWDEDTNSLRFGMPVMYKISPNETDGYKFSSFDVHYTRVLHFADNALNSVVYGTPRLRRVYNRMADILKIVAGSAEMFWRGAYQGFSFEMDADTEVSDTNKKDMKLQIERFMQGLDRQLLLKGVKTNPIAPSIASPKDHLDVQLTMVSIASRIPKRILTGSEMGKLSSVQDAENWSDQVKTRRNNVATPFLLRPYIVFCVRNGIIRSPLDGEDAFKTDWPKLAIPSDEEQSKACMYYTEALGQYVEMSLYNAMDFATYLITIWKYPADVANELASKFKQDAFEKMHKDKLKAEIQKKKQSEVESPKKGLPPKVETLPKKGKVPANKGSETKEKEG